MAPVLLSASGASRSRRGPNSAGGDFVPKRARDAAPGPRNRRTLAAATATTAPRPRISACLTDAPGMFPAFPGKMPFMLPLVIRHSVEWIAAHGQCPCGTSPGSGSPRRTPHSSGCAGQRPSRKLRHAGNRHCSRTVSTPAFHSRATPRTNEAAREPAPAEQSASPAQFPLEAIREIS